jgi:hypothetical protein
MQELLFGSWGAKLVAYGQQYPFAVFATVLVTILVLDLMFARRRWFGGAGVDGWDGDDGGAGDGCGD